MTGPESRDAARGSDEASFLEALEAALERGAAQGEPVAVAVVTAASDGEADCARDAARPELPPSGLAARLPGNRLALLFPGLDLADVRRRGARIATRCPSVLLGFASTAGEGRPSGPRALLAAAEAAAGEPCPRILVVEDEPDVGEILEMFLSTQGRFEVLVARSGAEALTEATARRPDLVLLDLALPDMDGAALLRRLREVHPGLPALAVSGKRPEDAAGAGFTAFFRKPIDLASLAREVDRILRGPAAA